MRGASFLDAEDRVRSRSGPRRYGLSAAANATPDRNATELRSEARTAGRRLARTFGIFCVTLSGFVATGAALPVLPQFVRGPLHAGDVAVGVVMGAFAVSAVLARPFAGRLADRRGRRPVLAAGAALCSIGGGLLLVASSVVAVVITRLIVGAGEGLLFK